ncbi:MAG: hypothetical protein ACXWU1_10015, partial [Allosphingosinicella sp.]
MTGHLPYEEIETASRDELAALQLERLRWSLAHAYQGNARYRAKFDAAGVHPDDFRSHEDLARFPFTTKADLRDAYPFDFFAVPQERLARIHASSGTTGKPTVVGYTKRDIDTWSRVMARSIHAAGGRPGMKVHVAYGYGLFTGGLGAHRLRPRLGAEDAGLQRGSARIEPLAPELVEDGERVARRDHDDLGPEVGDQLHLLLGLAAGHRDH